MAKESAALEQQIYETAGEKFNLASPKQLGDILFDKLKIGGAKQKKTKTGQYATGEEILSYLAQPNPNCARHSGMATNGEITKYLHIDALPEPS